MAHSLSAKKRARQSIARRDINRARKSRVKTQIKRFDAAITAGDLQKATEQFRLAAKLLDQVSATSTMHKKTAARKKSRLDRRLNALLKAKAAS